MAGNDVGDGGAIDVGLAYDMRAPDFGTPAPELYRAAIEQCAWADAQGFTSVTLSEHHASEDGYLPSPIVLGAAIAGATDEMLIRLSLILLPLYHPIRAAEDLAVLDLASGGRLRLMVGAGYRAEEYEQFGLEIRRRPSLMEEGIETLVQAWTGEEFDFRGNRVRVLPRPAQRPRPDIVLGGASPASARRAARLADDYQPLSTRLYELYLDELDALGKPRPKRSTMPGGRGPMFVHVSEDPDRDWERIAPHALYESNAYGAWTGGARGSIYKMVDDADELRRSGAYVVVTPDEAVVMARERGAFSLKPLMGGLDPELGWSSLRLFAQKCLPRLRDGDRS